MIPGILSSQISSAAAAVDGSIGTAAGVGGSAAVGSATAGSTGAATGAGAAAASTLAAPPLDGLSPTGAWSASRDLLTTFIGGSRYTDAGSGAISSFKDQSGNSRDLNDGTFAARRPTLTTGGPNSRSCLDFDGSSDVLSTEAGVNISNFMTASNGYMVISLIADAVVVNDATAYNNDGVLADIGGFMGIYLRNTAGTPETVQAYNFDGSVDVAASAVINTGTVYVVEWRHEGGNLYVRVNGTGEQTAASGNMSTLSNPLGMGAGYSGSGVKSNIKVFEAAVFSTVPGSTARDALVADLMSHVGAV